MKRRRRAGTLGTGWQTAASTVALVGSLAALVCQGLSTTRTTTPTQSSSSLSGSPYLDSLGEALTTQFGSSVSTPTSRTRSGLPPFSNDDDAELSWGLSSASLLGMICDDDRASKKYCNQEFEVQLGKVLDTLKHDYQDILTHAPDYSIYNEKLSVVDPSGVTLHGVKNYKNAFRLVHTIVDWFYCKDQSLLTFRMMYSFAHHNIRVSWNAEVVPKKLFGGTKTTLHVDGISVYELDPYTAEVTEHRVEHLLINETPVKPEEGLLQALRVNVADAGGIPVLMQPETAAANPFVAKFQSPIPSRMKPSLFRSQTNEDRLSIMNAMASPKGQRSMADDSSTINNSGDDMDWDAFRKKNETRKKFGLKPLTPEEYVEMEAQIQQLSVEERQRQASMTFNNDATPAPREEKKKGGIFGKIFGEIFEDTCESNWDCDRPEVCCDFGFKKMCCSSGAMVGNPQLQPALIPVPQGIDDFPQGQGRPQGGY